MARMNFEPIPTSLLHIEIFTEKKECWFGSSSASMIRRGMTRAQEERMRAENRKKEYQREDNKRLVAQERMMHANVACDERVENKRFIRRLQQVYSSHHSRI